MRKHIPSPYRAPAYRGYPARKNCAAVIKDYAVWQRVQEHYKSDGCSTQNKFIAKELASALLNVCASIMGRYYECVDVCNRQNGKVMEAPLKRAGLPRVRFHDLRHTFATITLQNGVDVKTVSSMLGHYSAGFTPNTIPTSPPTRSSKPPKPWAISSPVLSNAFRYPLPLGVSVWGRNRRLHFACLASKIFLA